MLDCIAESLRLSFDLRDFFSFLTLLFGHSTAMDSKAAKPPPSVDMEPPESLASGAAQHVQLGYAQQLKKNRSLLSIFSMSLAIVAVPYGIGSTLTSAIYGGGQLSLVVGLLVVLILDGAVAVSLAELSSIFPTSSGAYYWTFRLTEGSEPRVKNTLSFLTGWLWLVGNWTIVLSVNFGIASLIAATVSIYWEDWLAKDWELLLILYGQCLLTFVICAVGDRLLSYVDIIAAIWNFITIIVVLVSLSATAKEGKHSASVALGSYNSQFSGWGDGFTFFIGLLPPAYAFCAIGMVTSMSEECLDPQMEVPRAITLVMPMGGLAALFFILPICFTLPPLEQVLQAPYGQAMPYVLKLVLGSRGGALVVMIAILLVALFCSISITTSASRYTWAFSRDKGIPGHTLWSRIVSGSPLPALALVTVIEMLLGLIYLASSSAFTAFVSVGVMSLSAAYLVPIATSLASGRKHVSKARWTLGPVWGIIANIVAIIWILFEMVLFSMPTALPVTLETMNYASVVFIGFLTLSAVWYAIWARKCKSATLVNCDSAFCMRVANLMDKISAGRPMRSISCKRGSTCLWAEGLCPIMNILLVI